MKEQLKLEHLAPYLPYGLKYIDKDNNELKTMRSLSSEINMVDLGWGNAHEFSEFKPILRPLSDLTKINGFSLSDMISHGYHNTFWLPENFEVKYLMHLDFEKMVSWHFDVFGLIEKGLAIDKNTL